ncbi:hypothetical protein NKOR_08480 [Candidatus Nitrosopumilus koreensis AR1]|uniref:N,N-dimethylformamidase beta subunit-like C-terminal domain-containing protein n=1 Tax=Candidatus Nitrosopumilus koreensis AR1 TaxID=1229908 RepID=K0B5T7_9ARCH|nr:MULTISPECIES: N,N-dimethylformamidase beta subunit family domain-containing protein [Nitrosopumilus]AFS81553.1 hypothetical protein NKOR_08480 [Candidatus Nitrosopumilus koreensis AR1]
MKKVVFALSGIIILITVVLIFFSPQENLSNTEEKNISQDIVFDLNYNPGGNRINLDTSDLFLQYTYEEDLNKDMSFRYSWFEPKEESLSIINEMKKGVGKTIVILPVFTHSAYGSNGFYDYYDGICGKECLTVKIDRVQPPQYNSGKNAIQILNLLGFEMISDIDVHKNPNILVQYDKVILLHNEYVTKEMFDAIDSHPKVLYLYPNALYAEVSYDEQNDEITLVKGHAYPDSSIDNGFNWEFDNTRPYEYDTECANWEFYKIDNGVMLNCYPEYIIWKDTSLLESIIKND